jgi:hypothetical protein
MRNEWQHKKQKHMEEAMHFLYLGAFYRGQALHIAHGASFNYSILTVY